MLTDSNKVPQESTENLKNELTNLANRIGTSTDRIVGVGNNLMTKLERQSNVQSFHQKTIIALTVVIALSTMCYTYITWLSVQVTRDANEIQRQQNQIDDVSEVDGLSKPSSKADCTAEESPTSNGDETSRLSTQKST